MLRGVVAAGALLLLAGCTSGHDEPPTPPPVTTTATVTHVIVPSTAPVVAGPTSTKKGTCPFAATQTVADDVGMRLARITVQSSGGTAIGCEFFALQNSSLATSERLPGPKQPVLKILITRYPSATAAHNAMVRTAAAGTHAQQYPIGDTTGVAFQTDFYPADKGTDWAVAFTRGKRLVVVHTVVTSPSLSAVVAARHIAEKIN